MPLLPFLRCGSRQVSKANEREAGRLFQALPRLTRLQLRTTAHCAPRRCNLALGAICAQKSDRFWAYHDKVFQRPPKNASVDDVVAIGLSVGLEAPEFRSCIGSASAGDELTRQVAEAKRVGVKSTSTAFLNNKKLPNVNVLIKAVESESKRLGI